MSQFIQRSVITICRGRIVIVRWFERDNEQELLNTLEEALTKANYNQLYEDQNEDTENI